MLACPPWVLEAADKIKLMLAHLRELKFETMKSNRIIPQVEVRKLMEALDFDYNPPKKKKTKLVSRIVNYLLLPGIWAKVS